MTDVKLALRGLRGESAADIIRRVDSLPNATDIEAIDARFGDEIDALATGVRDDVETAAALAGVDTIFATKAAADAGLSGVAANAYVVVMEDEDTSDHKTMYQKVTGAYVFVADLSTITDLSAPGSPRIGEGRAIGAPPAGPTLTEGAAGALTGTYRYAYTETDGTGETSLSPVSSPITVTSKKINVSVPSNRRGTSQRKLYRTVAGGSVYKLVKDFDGGDDYYRSLFIDDVADGSLGATAPSSDSTYLSTFEVNQSVKFFRTHPDQGDGPADLTVLTGNGAAGGSGGAYSIDFYGPCLGRTRLGTVYQSRVTGDLGTHFLGYHVADSGVLGDVPADVTQVFKVGAKGNLTISPLRLSDPSLADGHSSAFSIVATMPSAPTAATIAAQFSVTGSGSASYSQTAHLTSMGAGYTGSSATYAQRLSNASAHTGTSFGLDGRANGAAALNVGVAGLATVSSKCIGIFGSGDGTDVSASMFRSGVPGMGGAFTNGSGVGDIIVGLDGTTPVFYVENGGDTTIKNVGSVAKLQVIATSGGGVLEMQANGGNDVRVGSTNNVPLLLRANGATVVTVATGGSVGINESVPDYKLDVNGTFGFSPGASVTPVDNGDVVFELTSNTSLTVKAKGSDGTVRSVVLTLA
jgi:hypothetical protein